MSFGHFFERSSVPLYALKQQLKRKFVEAKHYE